jgi:NAD(P)-dependent dehydrogenase (short-subunit alcohol dehydrogenase family)
VNLKGVLNCCHTVLPLMKEARQGSVVAMSAARGLRGGPNAALYSAMKAGIILFVQAVSSEVAPFGVRINSVVPGSAEARWRKSDGRPAQDDRSPLGRATNEKDIGEGVAFLMSDEASHITGSCLDVSGGTALH